MWIAKKDEWDSSHTDLTKYFIERLKQKVDYEETISNRHRTTNGFTLIAEVVEVAQLTQKRIKSIHRLISLINELNSKVLSSSLKNDFIIQNYHSDIIDYYQQINPAKLKDNGNLLSELISKSQIHLLRLESDYYNNIIFELKKIDFNSSQFKRNSDIIDSLIECLIPYLLHIGYSVTSISDMAYTYIKKDRGLLSPLRITNYFSNRIRHFCFLIRVENNKPEIQAIFDYLKSRDISYTKVTYDDIKDFLFPDFDINSNECYYQIKHSTLDPHNYLRNIYEIGLKNHVAVKDRLSLQFFTNFFEKVYWKFDTRKSKYQKTNIAIDPINVPNRKSTLIDTLDKVKRSYDLEFDREIGIPIIKELRDSLYYYNLALGSKSIENSLSLLWTSLETLLPYRLKSNDIENVQYFVSKSLSIGSIGREVTSFIQRYIDTNWRNGGSLEKLGLYTSYINYKPEGIRKWIDWLSTSFEETEDPYQLLQENSNLLCKSFCNLNDKFTGKNDAKVESWLNRIENSQESIKYQLDRIYLHRNQIVHSGKFINEYSNLWNHLEWYVGKLLAFAVYKYLDSEDKNLFNKEQIFMQLEADVDLLTNLLENNKNLKINEIKFAYTLIAKESWQFF